MDVANGPVSLIESQTAETVVTELVRRRAGRPDERCRDSVVAEAPLEIRVRGRSIAVTMRTPGQDRELAAGFLLTEGIVRRSQDLLEIAPCRHSEVPENTLNIFLARGVEVDFGQLTRHVFASSSCGLCGKASIDAVHQHFPPVESVLEFRQIAVQVFV